METRWEIGFPIRAVSVLEDSVSRWLAAFARSWSNSWWCKWQPATLNGFFWLQNRTECLAPRQPKHSMCLAQKATLSTTTKYLNLEQWSNLWSPSHLKQRDRKWTFFWRGILMSSSLWTIFIFGCGYLQLFSSDNVSILVNGWSAAMPGSENFQTYCFQSSCISSFHASRSCSCNLRLIFSVKSGNEDATI